MKKTKILLTAAEAAPFAVLGDLAEVAGTLPFYLQDLGADVRVVVPYYKTVRENPAFKPTHLTDLEFEFNGDTVKATVLEYQYQGLTFYFIEKEEFFFRDGFYQYKTTDHKYRDYEDNLHRFAFFSKAALELIPQTGFIPEVVHCYAWHTALIPVYLKSVYADREPYNRIRTLFTIPNIAFQGLFPGQIFPVTGLPDNLFAPDALEYYGMINLLKGGLLYADALNTVSRQYAREIQTPQFGYGLEGVIQQRRHDITGITDGIDYENWDPAKDPYTWGIHFDRDSLQKKRQIKERLLDHFNLDPDLDRPLLIYLSRLEAHKGMGLLEECREELLQRDTSMIILGTGNQRYIEFLNRLQSIFPDRISYSAETKDTALLHRLIAGADILLMPSEFEPCGLHQQLALRYGTVPLVHSTGGLADTVSDNYNGFVFHDYNGRELLHTMERTLEAYHNKAKWKAIQKNGMDQDWSWANSAKKYYEIYLDLIESE